MDFDLNTLVYQAATWILPLLFAFTMTEAAKGWVAHKLGDDSAQKAGRLSWNPFQHIDLIGSIVLPLILLLTSMPILLGWGKPIPMNPSKLKNERTDMALIMLAGIASHLMVAFVWVLLLVMFVNSIQDVHLARGFADMCKNGLSINLIMVAISLLPIPPMPGAHLMVALFPNHLARLFESIAPYGVFIVIGILYFGGWTYFVLPIVNTLAGLLSHFFF